MPNNRKIPDSVVVFHALLGDEEIVTGYGEDADFALINKALETSSASERKELKSWVDSVLAGNYSDAELRQIWNNSGAEC